MSHKNRIGFSTDERFRLLHHIKKSSDNDPIQAAQKPSNFFFRVTEIECDFNNLLLKDDSPMVVIIVAVTVAVETIAENTFCWKQWIVADPPYSSSPRIFIEGKIQIPGKVVGDVFVMVLGTMISTQSEVTETANDRGNEYQTKGIPDIACYFNCCEHH